MSKPPVVVAHRGWPTRFPDNVLAGFIAATRVADMVELDVRRSADGKLLLSHDPVMGGQEVARTTWSQLVELDVGGGHHPALLDEVLAALTGTPVQMEIKNRPGEFGYEPDHRLALEAASRARPGDIVTSFNPDSIGAVRRDFSDVATGLAIGIPADVSESARYCLEAGHSALIPAAGLLVDPVAGIVASGVDVYPWTVNDADVAGELVEAGATGIITDTPGYIAEAIRGDR